ncbi:MAG: MerR family transcriptional regulator [Dehalococcoidia bacterium]|jgi:DNA-binding transcriptional MerR regulator|nr:MerR family transcriptional regulator [Dehalococcoidia bacterium]MDW8009794.1 MerR family transcriptional regulator [Chloroflexota bacterium]
MAEIKEFLQIGEAAEKAGVSQRTLRFYEEKGLLRPPARMEGGFRLYTEEDVRRVKQIKKLQQLLGVSLAEIKEMVEAQDTLREIRARFRPDAPPAEKLEQLQRATEVVQRQYEIVRHKVDQLLEMKSQLEEWLRTFERWRRSLEQEAAREGQQG